MEYSESCDKCNANFSYKTHNGIKLFEEPVKYIEKEGLYVCCDCIREENAIQLSGKLQKVLKPEYGTHTSC